MANNAYGNSFITFYVDKILGKSWNQFKENWSTLLLALLATSVVSFGTWIIYFVLVLMLSGSRGAGGAIVFLTLLFVVAGAFLGLLLSAGWVKLTLNVVDNKKPEVSDLFSQMNKIFPFLAVVIMYIVILMAGLMLFVIPGIIWGIMFMWAPILIIDKGLGPIEALKKSKELTEGSKWDLFLYKNLDFALVSLISSTVVGIVLVVPFSMLAKFELYRQTHK